MFAAAVCLTLPRQRKRCSHQQRCPAGDHGGSSSGSGGSTAESSKGSMLWAVTSSGQKHTAHEMLAPATMPAGNHDTAVAVVAKAAGETQAAAASATDGGAEAATEGGMKVQRRAQSQPCKADGVYTATHEKCDSTVW